MAFIKLPYNWEKVEAGDIISFKYKSQRTGKTRIHSILVLNPALIRRGAKKISTQLIGIKLEESNKIQLEITKKQIQIFELIGTFKTIDKENNLYKLDIDRTMIQNDLKGIKPRAYDLLKKGLGVAGQYRTYDYYKARKSAVYLEPIKIFTQIEEDKTVEDKKKTKKPEQPKKPKQPKKIKTETKKPEQPKKPKQPSKPESTTYTSEQGSIDKFYDKVIEDFKKKFSD